MSAGRRTSNWACTIFYLSEACEKVGVKFESVVSQIKESDTTVIALSFYL
jgi:hypothetical protein